MPLFPASTYLAPSRRLASAIVASLALVTFSSAASAQAKPAAKPAAKGASDKGSPSLVGMWSGTATIPLKDSTLVVPVVYTFTQNGGAIGGTAMVPGQGVGPISDVVRAGAQLTWNVTAPEGKILAHEGNVTADGAIEGMVIFEKAPVAKFRITPKAAGATTK